MWPPLLVSSGLSQYFYRSPTGLKFLWISLSRKRLFEQPPMRQIAATDRMESR
jgi:hypothetical protein